MKFNMSKTEVEKILEVMKKFPQNVDSYKFDYSAHGGIGHTLDMFVTLVSNNIEGEFKIDITDTSNW